MEKIESLYVHFPYCETKCHYCDFFSLPEAKHPENQRSLAYSALLKELELNEKNLQNPLHTVFFGGGTPSLAPLPFMESFIAKLKLTAATEFTMEANPSSITLEKAKTWKTLGIQRISMGLQALDDSRLKWLGRAHSKASAFTALDCLFEAGFEKVSVDYILGVPNQTREIIQDELSSLLKEYPAIQHLSAYLLTLKSSNPKFKELPTDDEQLLHLETARDVLKSFGLEQYEISNFSKPGFEAAHNINYWNGGSYLGIGPSAHSFFNAKKTRSKNWGSLHKYIEEVNAAKIPWEWSENLTLDQLRMEFVMLKLRQKEGFFLSDYQDRFQEDFSHKAMSQILKWQKLDLLEITPQKALRLKNQGFFLSDHIIESLI